MPLKVRGKKDKTIDAMLGALAKYESEHPRAEIVAYRQNSASIRVRIVDPDFDGVSRTDRHETVWRVLDELPDKILSHLSILLLLAPSEMEDSFANFDFDDPARSKL